MTRLFGSMNMHRFQLKIASSALEFEEVPCTLTCLFCMSSIKAAAILLDEVMDQGLC